MGKKNETNFRAPIDRALKYILALNHEVSVDLLHESSCDWWSGFYWFTFRLSPNSRK